MKKTIQTLTALLLITVFFAVSASAHSGNTDGQGGHYDSDTGEYHFHHGFPAHHHADLDFDGYADCPYDFVDATSSGYSGKSYDNGYSAGEESGYSIGYDSGYEDGWSDGLATGKELGYPSGYSDGKKIAESKAEEEYEAKLKEEISAAYTDSFWIAVFSFIPLIIFISSFLLDRQERKFDEQRISLRNELRQTKAAYEQQILRLKNETVFRESSATEENLPDLPAGVRLVKSCIPVKGADSKKKPFGDYTIYITRGGKKYHCKCSCSSADIPVHFFERPAKLEPCSICVPKDMYPHSLPEWYIQICKSNLDDSGTSSSTRRPSAKPTNSQADVVGPNPSSGIREILYDEGSLYISFGDGKSFRFDNIPEDVWLKLKASTSRENYFRAHIDGYYTYLLTSEQT